MRPDETTSPPRVLVSAGPTHEPIDPVRFLGNRSTGRMGFALAAAVAERGALATLVAGPVALPTPVGVERCDVLTALEMRDAIYSRAGAVDLIIMAAAVADFRPRSALPRKFKKSEGVLRLELVPNPDILAGLDAVAPRALKVGFAAETEISDAEAEAKLERKGADFLVVNDVSRPDIGFAAADNEVTVYQRSGAKTFFARRPKDELAITLIDLFFSSLAQHHEVAVTTSLS